MKTVKINFRVKSNSRFSRSWKVYITKRVRGVSSPKQIHIGYIDEDQCEKKIPVSVRKKLTKKVNDKLKDFDDFNEGVVIDWDDAETKLHRKIIETPRSELTKTSVDILCVLYKYPVDLNIDEITIRSGYDSQTVRMHLISMRRLKYVKQDRKTFSISPSGEFYLEKRHGKLIGIE